MPIRPISSLPTRAPKHPLVPVTPRHDGWTPQRQRAFLEVLADTGSVTAAAQAVGLSPSSAYRLRRRADARAFDAAWDAALERALALLVPAAIDRALNGTVRQRWYHGEIIAEERVHSDRLLMYMMDKGRQMLGHHRARDAVRDDWTGAMDGIEAGATEPPEPAGPDPDFEVVTLRYGDLATNCPPPPFFRGRACRLARPSPTICAFWKRRSCTPGWSGTIRRASPRSSAAASSISPIPIPIPIPRIACTTSPRRRPHRREAR